MDDGIEGVQELIIAMQGSGTIEINLVANGDYPVAEGPYNDNGATGFPIVSVDKIITINGNGATIRATGSGFRLFAVVDGNLTLNNLTLQDATLDTNGGAALLNVFGNVTINNVIFENNYLEVDEDFGQGMGGAIYNFGSQSNLTITDSVFRNNRAIKFGGALYNWDGVINITGSTFESNQADRFGGAIGQRGGQTNGSDNIYRGNIASQNGGAFYIEGGTFSEIGAIIEANVSPGAKIFYNAASGELSGNPDSVNVTVTDSNIISHNQTPNVSLLVGQLA